MKPVILTGLRANNDLHIGNYFGALLPMIDMANRHAGEYQINLFVPDLHSFTTPIDHKTLYDQTLHNLKLFVAAGLDIQNPDLFLYRQSFIPAHSELAWILDCFTGFGELSRMTQFKDKSVKLGDDRISVGLFNYPVLMAADMLLYGASYVPVGEDQTQHLEYTRDLAERMNSRFGELFVVPKPVKEQHEFFGKDQGLRIKDLVDPTKKMSKSDEIGKGIIFLGDKPEDATKKIMAATTDSLNAIHFNPGDQPGIANLLQILSLLDQRPLLEVTQVYDGKTSYGELKANVSQKIETFLTDFQTRLESVDERALITKLESSETAMCKVADEILSKVQQAVGLRQELPQLLDNTADVSRYTAELTKLGIENTIVNHPAAREIAAVLKYLHLAFSDCMPALIMKGDGQYLSIVLRGDTKADFKKIKTTLAIRDLRMATPDEFTNLTGLPIGAARIYTPGVETIIDKKVFEKDYLTSGSGRFDCSIRYKTADLEKIPNSRTANISSTLH